MLGTPGSEGAILTLTFARIQNEGMRLPESFVTYLRQYGPSTLQHRRFTGPESK
jgi:hypothetical protein